MLTERYSIRMRAANGDTHISGGERLGSKGQVEEITAELLAKACNHSRGQVDFVQITVEKISTEELHYIPALTIETNDLETVEDGRRMASAYLTSMGVLKPAIDYALALLSNERNLRGAAIVNALTGERLDDRGLKGVRVSRMDWLSCGSSDYSVRVQEALALATKVVHSPFTVAELCWSDDPDYVTGYMSSKEFGYVRISPLKNVGCASGGRVFFVTNEVDLASYINYLEKSPVLIHKRVSE